MWTCWVVPHKAMWKLAVYPSTCTCGNWEFLPHKDLWHLPVTTLQVHVDELTIDRGHPLANLTHRWLTGRYRAWRDPHEATE